MGRLYSGKKGKSGSHSKKEFTKPSWLRYDVNEIKLLIVKLAKSGKRATEIGLILRDTYGIPNVKKITGLTITQILKEHNLNSNIPDDLFALLKQYIDLVKHLEKNHKDFKAKRGLQLNESKIKRLVKYYKRKHILPETWKLNRQEIELLVQ